MQLIVSLDELAHLNKKRALLPRHALPLPVRRHVIVNPRLDQSRQYARFE
jgi:hypothetical protein